MSIAEYKKLKKLIDKIEDEALNKGIDITLPDFQLIIEKMLVKKGFTLAEYQEAEEKYGEKAIPEGVSAFKGGKGDKPIAGIDYKIPKDGKDGKTPIAGVDFPVPKDGIPGKDGEMGSQGPQGLQGEPADEKDLIKLQESFLEFGENIEDRLNTISKDTILNKDWSMEKKQNEMRWNKADDKLGLIRQTISRMSWGFDEQIKKLNSRLASANLEIIDLSSQLDGSETTFSLGKKVNGVIFVRLNDLASQFTVNTAKTQITLGFAPDSGETLEAIVI